MPNLKTVSTKVTLQHSNNRCPLFVAYCIKNFINLTSMIYIYLKQDMHSLIFKFTNKKIHM